MTRVLTWASFVWDQVLVRYVRMVHLKLAKRRTAHLSIALGVALTLFVCTAGHAVAIEARTVGEVSGLGITAAACYAMGPGCAATILCIMIVAAIAYLVVQLLFGLMMMLVWILIQAAAYNEFVTSSAVTLGWVLVRDVVNMFFIVVLLVIAFSTIIGYKPFHYKEYLPKLLLMAVLINFSRTLVGLMIDFSQVITLTFVNGFKQAASGNFAKIFGISGLLNASKSASGPGDVGSILIAIIFAIVIMTIATTTLTILVLYFIIRIVMLWVLIILSPVAFFVTALPGKMQAMMTQVSGVWWSKLSSWLTGGPIVAFFLWLSLAVVQQGTNEFTKIAAPTSETEKSNLMAASTVTAEPENIGLMIISVALMLTGLQTALTVSSQASPMLGQAASKIKAAGGPAGFIGRYAGRAAGRAAAPRIAQFAGNRAERSIQWAQKMGNIPVIGSTIAGANVAIANKFKGVQTGIRVAAEKRTEEKLKNLSTEDQLRGIAAMRSGKTQMQGADTTAALDRKQALLVTQAHGQKALNKLETERLKKEQPGLSEDQRNAMAADSSKSLVQGYLASAKKSAGKNGDTETSDKISEATKKNPSLLQSGKDVQESINGTDGKEITADAMKDGAVVAALLVKHGFVDGSGKLTASEDDVLNSEPIKKIAGAGGDRTQFFKAGLHDLADSSNGRLERMSAGLTSKTDVDLGPDRLQMSKSGDGKNILFGQRNTPPEARRPMAVADVISGSHRITNQAELLRGVTSPVLRGDAAAALARQHGTPDQFTSRLNDHQASALVSAANAYAAPPPSGLDPAFLGAQHDALASGIPTVIGANYDTTTNAYRDTQSRDAHQKNTDDSWDNVNNPATSAQDHAGIMNIVGGVNGDHANGEMGAVAVKSLNRFASTNLKNKLNAVVQHATGEHKKNFESFMKKINSMADEAIKSGRPLNPDQQNAVDLQRKVGRKAMKAYGGSGKP